MSPELTEAIAAAQDIPLNSPAYNWRGCFVIGPEDENFSDVLAELIAEAEGKKEECHYAPSPDAERKVYVDYRRRLAEAAREEEDETAQLRRPFKRLFSSREAQRQRTAA